MGAQIFDLQLKCIFGPLGSALSKRALCEHTSWALFVALQRRTLKAICSKKWAVPLVSSVSKRVPLSIHTPTVVVAPG